MGSQRWSSTGCLFVGRGEHITSSTTPHNTSPLRNPRVSFNFKRYPRDRFSTFPGIYFTAPSVTHRCVSTGCACVRVWACGRGEDNTSTLPPTPSGSAVMPGPQAAELLKSLEIAILSVLSTPSRARRATAGAKGKIPNPLETLKVLAADCEWSKVFGTPRGVAPAVPLPIKGEEVRKRYSSSRPRGRPCHHVGSSAHICLPPSCWKVGVVHVPRVSF